MEKKFTRIQLIHKSEDNPVVVEPDSSDDHTEDVILDHLIGETIKTQEIKDSQVMKDSLEIKDSQDSQTTLERKDAPEEKKYI